MSHVADSRCPRSGEDLRHADRVLSECGCARVGEAALSVGHHLTTGNVVQTLHELTEALALDTL